jgi:hypothetical protein
LEYQLGILLVISGFVGLAVADEHLDFFVQASDFVVLLFVMY